MNQIEVDGIPVTVVRKKIKSLNLYVKAPDGHVQVTAPMRTSDRAIHAFVRAHVDWIRTQQEHVRARHAPHRFVSGETVSVFGVPYMLTVREAETRRDCGVQQTDVGLLLTAPAGSTTEQREELIRRWQRTQLQETAASIIAQWSPLMHVQVKEWHIKRMKTKWGTCNYRAHRIWLNLALAEQPIECVEYVIVHELCHLLEPSHNERFWELMTGFLPDWKERRTRLNARPEQKES